MTPDRYLGWMRRDATLPLEAEVDRIGDLGCAACEVTRLALAEAVPAETGWRSMIVRRLLPQDDPRHRQPRLGRLRRLPAWRAAIAARPEASPEAALWGQAA